MKKLKVIIEGHHGIKSVTVIKFVVLLMYKCIKLTLKSYIITNYDICYFKLLQKCSINSNSPEAKIYRKIISNQRYVGAKFFEF